MSKKMVWKVELDCDKCKQMAMKTVASIQGVESVQTNTKEKKITAIGDADPVCITNKLKKFVQTELVSVGPAKEPAETQQGKIKKDENDVKSKEEKETPYPEANITYVYLPRQCEPCCGGYYHYHY